MKSKCVAKADEEALCLDVDVVAALILVDEAEAVASKQLGFAVFSGGTKHQVDVEGVHAALVAIPLAGGGSAANGGLGATRNGVAEHWANKRSNGKVAVDSDFVVEQHWHINEHLGVLGCRFDDAYGGRLALRVHTELHTRSHANAFGKVDVAGNAHKETLVVLC